MKFLEERGVTYDNVTLVPGFSEIESRSDIDTSVPLSKDIELAVPVVSANMDTVSGVEMCKAMYAAGGLGILHRFADQETIVNWVEELLEAKIVFGVSVGTNNEDLGLVRSIVRKAPIICIDVAHGHHDKVARRIKNIKTLQKDAIVIAGNVCTREGAEYLAHAGADIVKVGVGGGSLCSTRMMTGCGVPQLTAVMECSKAKDKHHHLKIIADGGITKPGDVIKALAAGADAVMLGGILAGTDETPGLVINSGSFAHPVLQKRYRGSASMETKVDTGRAAEFIEGTSTSVPYKGPVANIIKQIHDGLRSGMSYVGAETIKELHEKAVFMQVSSAGYIEGTPHGAK